MSAIAFVALSVAGGVGAVLRFVVDGVTRSRLRSRYPFGTTLINVSGSLVLGLLTGLALHGAITSVWVLILGTGLMGGYTTFSTASFETVRLLQDREYVQALMNGLGMLVSAVLAALLGLWIGSLV
jgi:CrcB protein